MSSGRPPGGPSSRPDRRPNASAEEGLRALGARIEGAGGPGAVANEEGLAALGRRIEGAPPGPPGPPRPPGGPARRGRAHRWRRWSTRRKVLVVTGSALALVLLVAGALYGYLQYRYDQISKQHVAAEVAAQGPAFNMLVIGSDSRVGESSSAFGSASVVTGQRSDVIMIWHVVPATKQISIISIPRDTLVAMVGVNASTFGKFNRINSSYNSGVNLLVQTIEANFGIPVNHVLQVNFAGFEGAVNSLGGIYLSFPYPVRDAWSGLNVATPGCQLLNGAQALSVARSRHYEYYAGGEWRSDPTSDFGRIQRQDAFIRALIDAAKSKRNPLTINSFLESIPKGLVIDDQLSLNDMIGLALAFHGIDASALTSTTLPTTSVGYVSPWGDVLFVDQPAAQQLLVSTFGNELKAPTTPPPDTSLVPSAPPEVTPTTAPLSGHRVAAAASTTPTTTPPPSFDPSPCRP